MEGPGAFLPVEVRKNRLLANPVTLAITPLIIGSPSFLSLLPDVMVPPDGNPLSPNRAGN